MSWVSEALTSTTDKGEEFNLSQQKCWLLVTGDCLTVSKSGFSFSEERGVPSKSHLRVFWEKGMRTKRGSTAGAGGGVRKRPAQGQTGGLRMCSL